MGGKRKPREVRICATPGCNNTFEVIITSRRKYCCSGGHATKGRKKPEGFGEKVSKATKGKRKSEESVRKMVETRRRKGSYDTSWNSGLTKEMDERVRKGVEKSTKTIKKQYENGRKGNVTRSGDTRPPEERKKASEGVQKWYSNLKNLKKFYDSILRGKDHPNWKGGVSKSKYPISFNKKLREIIRDRDNHTCQLCRKTKEEEGRNLCVHHIDYVKENLDYNNLITLCGACNVRTNYKREYWKEYFEKRVQLQKSN